MALSVGTLFTFIIVLLLDCGLLVWLAFYVLAEVNPPDPVGRIIKVVVLVIAVLVIVAMLLNFAGIGTPVRITG
jgi:hypothetical protein